MKKFLLFILIFIPALAMADETGYCGNKVFYRYNNSSQTLYISGQGRMYDYSRRIGFDVHPDSSHVTRGSSTDAGTRPWESYKTDIKHIVAGEGVTYIGERTFDGLQNLESVVFPSSLTEIGHTSFNDCSSLLNIYCYATRVPEHARDGLETSSKDCKLYVPASSVDLYKQYFDGIFQKNGSKYFRYIAALQDGDPVPPTEGFIDLPDYVGYILTYNNKIISLAEYKAGYGINPEIQEAIGVVFAPANQDHKILAVTLWEDSPMFFTDYIPLYCNTSCDTQAYDGYQNSKNMFNTNVNGHYSPLGKCYGWGLYHIPSYAESRLLYASIDMVNATIKALNPQKGETGVHRITVEFEGNTELWEAEVMVKASPDVSDHCDIFENGIKINKYPSFAFFENEPVRNYDFVSSADCNLMSIMLSIKRNPSPPTRGSGEIEPVRVIVRGYVNGLQKNMFVSYCDPHEGTDISFTADGLGYHEKSYYWRIPNAKEISTEDGDCWYWTSTEDEVDKENRAWLCSMKTGAFQQTPKTQEHRARAIISCDASLITTGICPPKKNRPRSNVYYSLSGQRVMNPKPGIYIQGGRKVVVK